MTAIKDKEAVKASLSFFIKLESSMLWKGKGNKQWL